MAFLAKRLLLALGVLADFIASSLRRWSQRTGRWTVEDLFRWQWRFSVRIATVSLLLFLCSHLWHWDRLQTDGPLTDALLRDVLAERETVRVTDPASSQPGQEGGSGSFRCFVPAGASAAAMAPYLGTHDMASAQAWIEPALPWLGGDWWVLEVAQRRITRMSRMDKTVLQPHPRMKDAQCVPTHALKLINAGVSPQGLHTFQVLDLSRTTAF